MKTNKREIRHLKAIEFRADQKDGKNSITGYAAVFNSLSEEMGWFGFRERVMAGAFKRTLEEKADVRGLINHDPNLVLGRTASKTLTLEEDDKGLKFSCDLPDTSYARDLMESIRRGDVSQCSFGFIVRKQTWIENKGEEPIRELNDVDLFDVSVVTYPAYADTSVAAERSLFPDGLPEDVRAHAKREKRGPGGDEDTCQCSCSECMIGNCKGCNEDDCDDMACEVNGCPMQDDDRSLSRSRKRAQIRAGRRKTKKVGGKSLTSDKFAYVGDENDTSTWKLPIHDPAHVRNALARFNQTEGIPEDQKDKVYKRIVAAAKKFGIKVSDDKNSLRTEDPTGAEDNDQELIDCLENVRDDADDFVQVAEDALNEINSDDEDTSMLEECLAEARELQGLLKDFIAEAEEELAEPESEEDKEKERMRMRVQLALRK